MALFLQGIRSNQLSYIDIAQSGIWTHEAWLQ
jgi:hypothetical protein